MEKLQHLWNAFDAGLIATITAIFVAGLAAVLGIWMERDERKPPKYAYALSGLIVLAMLVSITQSYLDKIEQDVIKEDMARLLTTMDKLASETDNPELLALVQSELSAQSRANPEVVEKVAQRVADAGEDPTEVLGKHLGEAELESVARKGTIKPKETGSKVAERDKDKEREAESKDAATAPTRRGASEEPAEEGGGRRRAAAAEEPAAVQPAVPVPTTTPPAPTADAAAAPAGRRGAATATLTPTPAPTTAPAPAPTDTKPTAKRPARDAKEPAKKGR